VLNIVLPLAAQRGGAVRAGAEALRPFGRPADAARGLALGLQGYFLLLLRPAAKPPLLRESITLLEAAGDDEGRAELLMHLGTAELAAADFAAARERYNLAAQLAERTGNRAAASSCTAAPSPPPPRASPSAWPSGGARGWIGA